MLNLAKGLAEENLDVDLILAQAEGEYINQVPENVRIIDLKSSRILKSLPKLIHYLKKENPESILSALTHANIVLILAKLFSKGTTRIVVSEHSNLTHGIKHSKSIKEKIFPLFMNLTYKYADEIVAVSNGVAEDLKKNIKSLHKDVKVIYNPILEERIFTQAKAPLNNPVPIHRPYLLSVGRLTEAKDYATLISAFSLIAQQYDGDLLILGEGEEKKRLEALAIELGVSNRVLFLGFTDNPYKYMRNCDLFVLSSKWEGLPTVLVEALAVGSKVVSTRCPSGPEEILKNGEIGILTPVGDEIKMAENLLLGLRYKQNINPEIDLKEYYSSYVVNSYKKIMIK
ncbi:glycosyltransferase [Exiguobacterium sp. SH1S4]|nr:glycosyltransferase [Exiguobacterium sp. SH5S32]TCI55579.1 glycosyltransferase [Exiguobacterium sp. SH1S4]TCI75375.1 glycosyltransferase [Exiguobacterium sp. SH1S1]